MIERLRLAIFHNSFPFVHRRWSPFFRITSMPCSDRRYIYKTVFFYSSSGGGESISLGFLLTFFGVTPREIIVGVNKHRTRYVSGVCRHSIYNIYRTIYLYIIYKCIISCISKRSELLNLQSHKGTSTATVLNIPKYSSIWKRRIRWEPYLLCRRLLHLQLYIRRDGAFSWDVYFSNRPSWLWWVVYHVWTASWCLSAKKSIREPRLMCIGARDADHRFLTRTARETCGALEKIEIV